VDEDGVILTSYFHERQRAGGKPLGEALMDLFGNQQVAASILLRGAEGSGRKQQARTGHSVTLAEDLPLTAAAIAVDTRPRIEAVLGQVRWLTRPGLVTARQARLLTGEIDPAWLGENPGEATKLTLYLGRQDRVYQVPAFEAACELLHRRGISGATVLSGIDGTTRGRRQHAQFLRRVADVPITVIAIGSGDRIGMILPELGAMSRHPLMTVEKVLLCKRDGQLISRPRPDSGAGAQSTATRLKLTVYTSEATQHEGQPVCRAITRQLRSAGISGVTTFRGIWGFHGDRPPHGDRFLPPGHHVPVVTAMIGTPGQADEAFDVVDKMTADRGLVTAETVTEVSPSRLPPRRSPSARSACTADRRPGGRTEVAWTPSPPWRTAAGQAEREQEAAAEDVAHVPQRQPVGRQHRDQQRDGQVGGAESDGQDLQRLDDRDGDGHAHHAA
jgi:PII-like signaling protein